MDGSWHPAMIARISYRSEAVGIRNSSASKETHPLRRDSHKNMNYKTLLLTLATCCGAACSDAALVAYYILDDATANAVDSQGSNTGTFIGSPTAVSGLFGNAYSFSGSDGVNTGSSTDVRRTGGLTVTGWFRQSGGSGNEHIIGASNGIGNSNQGWLVKPQNGGRAFFNTAATS